MWSRMFSTRRQSNSTEVDGAEGKIRSVDLHSHILPGIDDGSGSVSESLEMLRLMREQGVEKVVATPHFYPGQITPQKFLERRDLAVAQLSEALEKEKAKGKRFPSICVGAEVAFFNGISRSEVISELCIKGTRLLLVEMPFESWSEDTVEELFRIKTLQGLVPVVAHIERYLAYQNDPELFSSIFSGEIIIQSNASAFLDRKTSKRVLKMLAEGEIDLLGSDCHNLGKRAPNMSQGLAAIRKSLGDEAVEELYTFGNYVLEEAKIIM